MKRIAILMAVLALFFLRFAIALAGDLTFSTESGKASIHFSEESRRYVFYYSAFRSNMTPEEYTQLINDQASLWEVYYDVAAGKMASVNLSLVGDANDRSQCEAVNAQEWNSYLRCSIGEKLFNESIGRGLYPSFYVVVCPVCKTEGVAADLEAGGPVAMSLAPGIYQALNLWPDSDKDAVPNQVDNCDVDANFEQLNTYGDWRGDACEPKPVVLSPLAVGLAKDIHRVDAELVLPEKDSDQDGIPDDADNCPFQPNPQQGQNDCPTVLGPPPVDAATGDTDQDGVPDFQETAECVGQGTTGHVDAQGCPLAEEEEQEALTEEHPTVTPPLQESAPEAIGTGARYGDTGGACGMIPLGTPSGWPLLILIAVLPLWRRKR